VEFWQTVLVQEWVELEPLAQLFVIVTQLQAAWAQTAILPTPALLVAVVVAVDLLEQEMPAAQAAVRQMLVVEVGAALDFLLQVEQVAQGLT
jgi:hypothetical protein